MNTLWRAVIFAVVLMGTIPAQAQAQQATETFTIKDIVEGTKAMDSHDGKWVLDNDSKANLPKSCHGIEINGKNLTGLDCLRALTAQQLKQLSITFKQNGNELSLKWSGENEQFQIPLESCGQSQDSRCVSEDMKNKLVAEGYFLGDDGWTSFKPQGDEATFEVSFGQMSHAYLVDDQGQHSRIIFQNGTSAARTSNGADNQDDAWCDDKDPKFEVICADLAGDTREFLERTLKRGSVIPPNRSVLVRVRHSKGHSVRVKMGGDRGTTVLAIAGSTPAPADGTQGTDGKGSTAAYLTVVHQFAPRQPGKADLTIELLDGSKTVDNPLTLELEVEKTYAGALRVGLGTIFGGAVNAAYAAQTVSQSGQSEIIATTNNQFDLELTVGFAPFLEFFKGGRGYVGGRNYHFAPYIGVGVLDNENNSVRVLTSLHVGVEYEITPQTSVALTLVGRRVTRLADGLRVGDPVLDGAVLTRSGYQLGFALVFNLSPEFLKVLKRPGKSFFE